ncbi:hypothetical protein ANN_13138 [Periplaneta americana]|uniref:Uncharacterized protein n=1 Tax=Periplaneta americana TaxID=6978 RepID=A0ABQ8TIZ9_PERAM|nr:hypothetical protein ANN_13138 [Periplaneta americana]
MLDVQYLLVLRDLDIHGLMDGLIGLYVSNGPWENELVNKWFKKEELAGSLAEKKLPTEGFTGGKVNGRRVRGRRRYQIIDDIKTCGSCEETRERQKMGTIGEYWLCSERPVVGQNTCGPPPNLYLVVCGHSLLVVVLCTVGSPELMVARGAGVEDCSDAYAKGHRRESSDSDTNLQLLQLVKFNIMPFGAGRKAAPEWSQLLHDDDKKKVFCKHCNVEVSAKIERIKYHLKKCITRNKKKDLTLLEIELDDLAPPTHNNNSFILDSSSSGTAAVQ